jgi:hypothetical protein
MQNHSRFKRQFSSLPLLLVAIFSMMVLSVSFVQAQDEVPTETPQVTRNDPLWVQFTAARRAIEAERSVDLTYVRSYTYSQQEYVNGIDWICDGEVLENDVRPVYFGFTWTITDLNGGVHQARTSALPAGANGVSEVVVVVCDEVLDAGAPAPSTGDGGPIHGSGAVGSFELGGHVDGLGADTVQYMQQAGMTWVKKQLRYNVGNSTAAAQNLINDAKGKGFKILLGIVGYTNEMGNFDAYINSYAEFVGQVAALGPDAIEVWNEPNIAREWPQGQISGANYTRLLRAAYQAIKAANPNVMVISGAPAPTGAEAAFPGQVMNDDNFMLQMREAGAGNYFDCLGLHYNEGIVSPTVSTGAQDSYPTRYFGTMLARGSNIFPERPVCWTELGYLTGEGIGALPGSFNWASNVTQAQQTQWLADAARLSAQSGRVRMMIIWNINFTIWGEDPMAGYAIIRRSGGTTGSTSCAACAALGSVMGR